MQAVTSILEKLILRGQATYNVFNFAFGMFGEITIPQGSTAVITNITWYPFLNPIKNVEQKMTYRELFSFIEYQLKIDGKKSKNFHEFRNTINITRFNAQNLGIRLDDYVEAGVINEMIFSTGYPIQIPTYQVCEEFIKLTVSRNALAYRMGNVYNNVNSKAGESPAPLGVQNINVITDLRMTDIDGDTMQYLPPSLKNQNNPANNKSVQNYSQDFYGASNTNYNGALTEIQDIAGTNHLVYNTNPYGSFPLCSIGYVLINKNAFDELMNN